MDLFESMMTENGLLQDDEIFTIEFSDTGNYNTTSHLATYSADSPLDAINKFLEEYPQYNSTAIIFITNEDGRTWIVNEDQNNEIVLLSDEDIIEDNGDLQFVDNRKDAIAHGSDDPGFDEYDIKTESKKRKQRVSVLKKESKQIKIESKKKVNESAASKIYQEIKKAYPDVEINTQSRKVPFVRSDKHGNLVTFRFSNMPEDRDNFGKFVLYLAKKYSYESKEDYVHPYTTSDGVSFYEEPSKVESLKKKVVKEALDPDNYRVVQISFDIALPGDEDIKVGPSSKFVNDLFNAVVNSGYEVVSDEYNIGVEDVTEWYDGIDMSWLFEE